MQMVLSRGHIKTLLTVTSPTMSPLSPAIDPLRQVDGEG